MLIVKNLDLLDCSQPYTKTPQGKSWSWIIRSVKRLLHTHRTYIVPLHSCDICNHINPLKFSSNSGAIFKSNIALAKFKFCHIITPEYRYYLYVLNTFVRVVLYWYKSRRYKTIITVLWTLQICSTYVCVRKILCIILNEWSNVA